MGKWSKFKDTLKRYQPDASWQAQVDVVKANYLKLTDEQLKGEYNRWRIFKDHHELEVKKANTAIEALAQIVVDRFEDKGVTSMKFSDGTQLILKDTPYPFVENEELFMKWIKRKKLTGMLKMNYQTMAAMVNTMLLEGKVLPDGINVFMKTSITRRGGNLKEDENGDEANS